MDAPAISRLTQLDREETISTPRQVARFLPQDWAQPCRRILRSSAVPILAMIAAAAVLLVFPPTQYNFYPQCPIYQYLGILCPGCGTTRALAALLHGHLSEAVRLNPLTTLSIPMAILWKFASQKPLRLVQLSPAALWTVFCVVAAFTVMRNL